MNLQILSAGLGTRLRPFTDKIPKPALPVLNVPMIFYCYQYFGEQELNNIVVNGFHLQDVLRNQLKKYPNPFSFISDGEVVLGTGGGIANAEKHLIGDGFFWVINGDCIFLSDEDFVASAENAHKKNKPIATLVVTESEEVGKQFGGIWVDENDQVLDMGKQRPVAAKKGYHFTGFRILSDEIFKYLKKEPSELFDGLRIAINDGHKVEICKTTGEVFETGNLDDYLKTTETLLRYRKEKKYQKFLDSILKTYTPKSTLNDFALNLKMNTEDQPHSLFVEECFKLFEDTKLEGFVVAGKNVEIKEKCFLKNCVLLDGVIVPKNSVYENTIIISEK